MSSVQELARVRQLAKSGTARMIRLGARVTLRELAAELGVWPATLLRWERGERTPRGEKALAYGRALDELTKPR